MRLGKLLGSGYLVENEGISGTTLLKKGDMPYWTQGRLSQALAFNPKIVTIKLGTNDSKPQNWKYKSEFEADLNALIDTLGTLASKPVIWLCLPVVHFSDGVHPDSVGQDSLAHLIYRALTAPPTALQAPGIAAAAGPGWMPGFELRGRPSAWSCRKAGSGTSFAGKPPTPAFSAAGFPSPPFDLWIQ